MKKSFFVFITLSVFSLIFTGCESAGIILGGISQGINNSVGGSSSPSYSTSSSNSSSYSSTSSSYSDDEVDYTYRVTVYLKYSYKTTSGSIVTENFSYYLDLPGPKSVAESIAKSTVTSQAYAHCNEQGDMYDAPFGIESTVSTVRIF